SGRGEARRGDGTGGAGGAGAADEPGGASVASSGTDMRSVTEREPPSSDPSVPDDARDPMAFKAFTALQEFQLDQEREANDITLEALDQLDGALDGAARRQEVVHDQHLLAGLDRVPVDLEGVRPIFERVF